MSERYQTTLQGSNEVEVSEYLRFLQSMDAETLDCYYAVEQERIQVETLE